MLFYIKDRYSFKTKALLEAGSYSLIQSVWTDQSEIWTEYSDKVAVNDFIYNNNGWVGSIRSIEKNKDSMLIRAVHIEQFFDRELMWNGFGFLWPCDHTLTYFMIHYFKNGYTDGTYNDNYQWQDPEYQMQFLTVDRQTLEAQPSRPICSNGIFKMSAYFDQVRRLGQVYPTWEVTSTELIIHIKHENRTPKNIITTGTNIQVTEKTLSQKQVAKVTTYEYISGYNIPGFGDAHDFYLLQDGRITEDWTEGIRVKGEWALCPIQSLDDPYNSANNIFKENLHTHKITIQVPDNETQYLYYDPVVIEVDNQVYNSYISRVNITSDGYVEYTCGDLKTSLSDKINQLR